MKIKLIASVVGAFVIATILTGCGGGYDDQGQPRVDANYQACLDAGGSYQEFGANGGFTCMMSKDAR